MISLPVVLAVFNLALAVTRLYFCVKAARLMAIVWFLITYFMVFFIPVSVASPFTHERKFHGERIPIDQTDFLFALAYVAAFNLIFLVTELMCSHLFRVKGIGNSIDENLKRRFMPAVIAAMTTMWLVSSVLYFYGTIGFTYHNYVESVVSWPIVFFWASAPLASILALRKNYLVAAVVCLPYLYFASVLNVRSFALLTVIPVLVIFLAQQSLGVKSLSVKLTRMVWSMSIAGGLALMISVVALTGKNAGANTQILPDSGMPFGTVIMLKLVEKYHISTGFDALELYSKNLINPFMRLFGVKPSATLDPPAVMAQLFEGYDKGDVSNYFHYPTLWYTDAYIAFGLAGLFMPILWGFVLAAWEKCITLNPGWLALFFPAWCWHAYMLVRGATSGAAMPFNYAVYFSFIVMILSGGIKLFAMQKLSVSTPKKANLGWGNSQP